MKIKILTLFPQMFEGFVNESIIKRTIQKGLCEIECIDIRDYSTNKHRHVDDTPCGGGQGMILACDVVDRAIEANRSEVSHVIKDTPNVLGFLGTKGEADPLRPSEVCRILGKVDELTEMGEGSDLSFIVGETVVVNDGPFSSFSGIIEEVNEEKKKLKVMVKIFGRKTPLELSYFQVKRE